MMTRIATCQYQIEVLPNWQAYQIKVENLVKEAKQKDAQLLVLPEYAGIEIVCKVYNTDAELFAAVNSLLPEYLRLFQDLAKKYQLYIQPGTITEEVATNKYMNRAYFFSPAGEYGFQDKLQLVEVEKQLKVIQQGTIQTIFDTSLGKIGIAICYDSEFPHLVSNLTKAGAELILVPSFTASMWGYYRVAVCSRARAIENQCYVSTSLIVGPTNFFGLEIQGIGQSGVFGPADLGFPEDAILAQGKLNQVSEMIIADLDFKKIAAIRQNGATRNFIDALECKPLSSSVQEKKL